MTSLLVPVAAAMALGQALRDARLRAVFYLGACLPDAIAWALHSLGGASRWVCEPAHTPLGLLPWCYVAALLFEEEWRPRAFGALLGGAWLHLLIDLGRDTLGQGIAWAFPFSIQGVELRLYPPGDPAMTAGALAVIGVVGLGVLLRRRATSPAPTRAP